MIVLIVFIALGKHKNMPEQNFSEQLQL